MARRALGVRGARPVLSRILETPDLAKVVRALEPRALHQLVRTCGLEDCAEIVALATAEQLARVFDDDLWRSDAAGEAERFDAERFGLWLDVLAEVDVALAARKLVEMDFDLVTAAVTRHVLVLGPEWPRSHDTATDAGLGELDAEEAARAERIQQGLEDGLAYEIAGCRVVARRGESWDALLAVLVVLDADHHAFFSRLMRRCHRISAELLEDDGGEARPCAEDRLLTDLAADRERRRGEQGYVAPSDAAAFLKLARRAPGGREDAVEGRDPVTAAWFRERDERTKREDRATLCHPRAVPRARPTRLLEATNERGARRSRLRAELLFVREHDAAVHSQRLEEIAYLANVLVAGCSFQSRRFCGAEAAEAALATCNLGMENWHARRSSATAPGFLLDHDLVAVFRTGWRVLHEEVCLHAARRLEETLAELTCDDEEVQADLARLRRRLKAHVEAGTPWRVRDDLDVVAVLDQRSWAALLAVLNECPVLPRAAEQPQGGSPRLRVPGGFEFISENRQVACVHEFVESLPRRLV